MAQATLTTKGKELVAKYFIDSEQSVPANYKLHFVTDDNNIGSLTSSLKTLNKITHPSYKNGLTLNKSHFTVTKDNTSNTVTLTIADLILNANGYGIDITYVLLTSGDDVLAYFPLGNKSVNENQQLLISNLTLKFVTPSCVTNNFGKWLFNVAFKGVSKPSFRLSLTNNVPTVKINKGTDLTFISNSHRLATLNFGLTGSDPLLTVFTYRDATTIWETNGTDIGPFCYAVLTIKGDDIDNDDVLVYWHLTDNSMITSSAPFTLVNAQVKISQ